MNSKKTVQKLKVLSTVAESWQILTKKCPFLLLFFHSCLFFLPLLLTNLYEKREITLLSLCSFSFLASRQRWLYLSLSIIYFLSYLSQQNPDSLKASPYAEYLFQGSVLSPIVEEESMRKIKVKLKSFSTNNGESFHQSSSTHILYLKENNQPFSYADEIEFKAYLFQPRLSTSQETFDFKTYLKKQNIDGLLSLRKLTKIKHSNTLTSSFYKKVLKLRDLLIERSTHKLGEEKRAILEAILFSKKDSLKYENKVQYLESGLLHLFAVSGFHVGLVALFITILLRLIQVPYRINLLFSIILIFFYVMMAGFSPSSVRAWLMISFWAISQVLMKPQTAENSVAIAAWLLVLIKPSYLLDTGFIYSFIIVFTLILSAKFSLSLLQSLNEKQNWESHRHSIFLSLQNFLILSLLSSFLCSLVAFVSSLGLTLYFNALWTWSSIYLNLLAAVVLPLIFISAFISFIIPQISLLTSQLIELLNLLADLGQSSIHDKPSIMILVVFYFALFISLIFLQKRPKYLLASIAILLCSLYLISYPKNEAKLIFLSSQKLSEWSLIIQSSQEEAYIKSNKNWHDEQYINQFLKGFDGHSIQKLEDEELSGNLKAVNSSANSFMVKIQQSHKETLELTVTEERYLYKIQIKSNSQPPKTLTVYKDRSFSPKIIPL